jgi:hypothetical protein
MFGDAVAMRTFDVIREELDLRRRTGFEKN